jgi:hypothetical protein
MKEQKTKSIETRKDLNTILGFFGISVILVGITMFMDQYLHTGWLISIILPSLAVIMIIVGIRKHAFLVILTGAILFSIGLGTGLVFFLLARLDLYYRLGIGSFAFGSAWLLITVITALFNKKITWWALIPGSIFLSLGIFLGFSNHTWPELPLYTLLGVGIGFLTWSYGTKKIGLAIPGCLLVSIGPGIYLGWRNFATGEILVHIGTMLVWFSLGWGLIILFARLIKNRFVWWPLIPGGVLAMTGWSLYISSNPGSAIEFITKTSSIMLVLFGLYLLFLRRSLK